MGLKDRIEEEMVADTESMLDDNFDRAKELFQILEDGSLKINEEYQDVPAKEKLLIYFVGRRYAAEVEKVEKSTLPYDFFYDRMDNGKSTIRKYCGDLVDDSLVRKEEESGEREIVVESLSNALDRIEEAAR